MRDFNHIFCIGPGKSGTHSLWHALSSFGLSVLHLGNNKHNNGNVTAQINANFNNNRSVLTDVPVYNAYLDYPINEIDPAILDEQYPNSLFILTYRNPDDIALSWCRMCVDIEDARHHKINYRQYAENARRIYTRALTFAKKLPDRFLILDTQIAGWTNMIKLADFLGCPPPDKEWPHSFNHQDWYKKDA